LTHFTKRESEQHEQKRTAQGNESGHDAPR
jgi:hypothetical protein